MCEGRGVWPNAWRTPTSFLTFVKYEHSQPVQGHCADMEEGNERKDMTGCYPRELQREDGKSQKDWGPGDIQKWKRARGWTGQGSTANKDSYNWVRGEVGGGPSGTCLF